jgi:hypothetical protein
VARPTELGLCLSAGPGAHTGASWEGIGWAEVARFEDATLDPGLATTRQCRIVTRGGAEWGFLADYVAQYGRLTEVLRRKVDESRGPAGLGGSAR